MKIPGSVHDTKCSLRTAAEYVSMAIFTALDRDSHSQKKSD